MRAKPKFERRKAEQATHSTGVEQKPTVLRGPFHLYLLWILSLSLYSSRRITAFLGCALLEGYAQRISSSMAPSIVLQWHSHSAYVLATLQYAHSPVSMRWRKSSVLRFRRGGDAFHERALQSYSSGTCLYR